MTVLCVTRFAYACRVGRLPACVPQRVLVWEHKLSVPVSEVAMKRGRDEWWHEVVACQPSAAASCPVEWLDAEAPLFKLYTSGSTGG